MLNISSKKTKLFFRVITETTRWVEKKHLSLSGNAIKKIFEKEDFLRTLDEEKPQCGCHILHGVMLVPCRNAGINKKLDKC